MQNVKSIRIIVKRYIGRSLGRTGIPIASMASDNRNIKILNDNYNIGLGVTFIAAGLKKKSDQITVLGLKGFINTLLKKLKYKNELYFLPMNLIF